jgi:purine-binding chemotaxis protein CheW
MEHQYVAFCLEQETYGINIKCVSEIIRMQPVTRMPKNPDFVEGIINLRGRIIPVIDLKKQFGLGGVKESSDTRIMVVELGYEIVGMIVEKVIAVLS